MAENMLGTTLVTQIGILCEDIEATAKAYGDLLDLAYEITETDGPEKAGTKFMGLETPARCKQAFFKVGDQLEIELIQPDHNPSVWRDELQKKGEGVHHIAFWVRDTDGVMRRLEAAGYPTLQTGGWDGGRYAYIDTVEKLKTTVELLEDLSK